MLYAIRGALAGAGGSAYLVAGRDSVGIASDRRREVDAEEFDRLADLADAVAAEQALTLAQAPLLSDLADDWV